MLWLELRLRVREKKLWIVSVLYMLCLGFIFTTVLLTIGLGDALVSPSYHGRTLTYTTLYTLLGLLIILSPLAGAGRISQEHEQRTILAVLNTPVSRLSIVIGKLLSTWLFILWLASLCLPFLFVAGLWGGLPIQSTLLAFVFNVLSGMTCSAIALGLSGYFKRTATSTLTAGLALFFWCAVIPIFGGLFATLMRYLDGAARELTEAVLPYIFFYHNPVFPLIWLTTTTRDSTQFNSLIFPIYAIAVWIVITIASIAIATRSLKQNISV